MIKNFKIYGANGHRQRESFGSSYKFETSRNGSTLFLTVENQDITGTNDYTILRIEGENEKVIFDELDGQLYDGIFENSRFGSVVEF